MTTIKRLLSEAPVRHAFMMTAGFSVIWFLDELQFGTFQSNSYQETEREYCRSSWRRVTLPIRDKDVVTGRNHPTLTVRRLCFASGRFVETGY